LRTRGVTYAVASAFSPPDEEAGPLVLEALLGAVAVAVEPAFAPAAVSVACSATA
jgi:hypothetical protein